jgi:hypothetical protein
MVLGAEPEPENLWRVLCIQLMAQQHRRKTSHYLSGSELACKSNLTLRLINNGS